jgi:iron complex outermembrane recepter protein
MGVSITTPVALAKWWSANFFANVFNNRYRGVFDTINIDMNFTSFMVNVTNNFTIAKGLTAELSGFYRHRGLNNLSVAEPVYQISFGLQKQIINGKGTVRLNVRDPFAWQVFKGYNKYGLIDNNYSFRPDTRQVTATFTYRFGSSNPNAQPKRRALSSQDEQSRVGQGGQ